MIYNKYPLTSITQIVTLLDKDIIYPMSITELTPLPLFFELIFQ